MLLPVDNGRILDTRISNTGIQVVSGQGNGSTIPGFGFSPWHYVPAAPRPGHHPVSLFTSAPDVPAAVLDQDS